MLYFEHSEWSIKFLLQLHTNLLLNMAFKSSENVPEIRVNHCSNHDCV